MLGSTCKENKYACFLNNFDLLKISFADIQGALFLLLSVDANHDFFDGQVFSRGCHRGPYKLVQAEAAWHLHVGNRQALDVRLAKYLRELLPIEIRIVQLRTAHYHGLTAEDVPVKIGVREGNTVGRHEQVGGKPSPTADTDLGPRRRRRPRGRRRPPSSSVPRRAR